MVVGNSKRREKMFCARSWYMCVFEWQCIVVSFLFFSSFHVLLVLVEYTHTLTYDQTACCLIFFRALACSVVCLLADFFFLLFLSSFFFQNTEWFVVITVYLFLSIVSIRERVCVYPSLFYIIYWKLFSKSIIMDKGSLQKQIDSLRYQLRVEKVPLSKTLQE